MSLRSLASQSMIHISSAWLDPEHTSPILESRDLTKALLPKIQSNHDTILNLLSSTPDTETITRLNQQAKEHDHLHDRTLRAIYYTLTGLTFLHTHYDDDPSPHRALRDKLFPVGLRGVNLSYRDQAGAIQVAKSSLTDDDITFAKSISIGDDKTLHDSIQTWMNAGTDLGNIDDQRATLSPDPDTSGPVYVARNEWIRTARLLERIITEIDEFSEDEERSVLGPMRDALKRTTP